jgi:DNA-binding MarR family transcriptional regulator
MHLLVGGVVRRLVTSRLVVRQRTREIGVDYGDKLFWLSVLIQRKYAQICAEFDLTPSQATLLCAVRDEPRQMADLAASLGMTKNALSQLVDRTARRELVGRASSAQDRRVVMLSATPAGKVLGEAVYAEVAKRLPEIAGSLDADDQRDFERLAAAIVDTSGVSASTSDLSVAP